MALNGKIPALATSATALIVGTAALVVTQSAGSDASPYLVAAPVSDGIHKVSRAAERTSVETPVSGEQTDDLTDGRIVIEMSSRKTSIPFKTKKINDAKLPKGTTKVDTKGSKGVRVDEIWTVKAPGKPTKQEVVASTITKKPVTHVLRIGTMTADSGGTSSGKKLNLARADMWERIAKCESTNRWNINTGNGYYGGLQFNLATWRSVGGTDFAAYPHQATRAEQITVANRLYAKRGLQPWGCRHAA